MIGGTLSIMYGLRGPNLAIVTACTTGLHSIGDAGRMIEYGDADVMLAGGAESTICPLGLGGFDTMKAVSTRTTTRRQQAVHLTGIATDSCSAKAQVSSSSKSMSTRGAGVRACTANWPALA